MKLDVKTLTFGAVGETDNFDLSLEEWKIADDLVAKDLRGKVKLTRLDESILVQAKGVANLGLECDRCVTRFDLEVPFDFSLEYFLGGFRDNEEDLLVDKNFEVDIEEPLREEILLAVPVKKLCRKDCKGLCPHCGADLNKEECQCSQGEEKQV